MLNTNLTVENEPAKKKQRFASLDTSELDILLDSAKSQNTKYNTSFAVSVYKGKLYWCRRGREGRRKLTSSSFKFLRDENNRPYATMTHDKSTKNHPGGVGDAESFEKEGRLYQATDDPSDGFNALRFYISKLNPECTAFFQYPKRKWSPSDSIWYKNRPLGIQKLGTMMKELSEAACLEEVHKSFSEGNGNYPLVQCWPL